MNRTISSSTALHCMIYCMLKVLHALKHAISLGIVVHCMIYCMLEVLHALKHAISLGTALHCMIYCMLKGLHALKHAISLGIVVHCMIYCMLEVLHALKHAISLGIALHCMIYCMLEVLHALKHAISLGIALHCMIYCMLEGLHEGEVNPLKNSRTFEEITDACIKVGEEIDSEPFYHTTDGNDELVSDYIDSKYKVPECILNVVRYFKYSHVFYVNCFDCGDSKWAEQDMRIYIQVNMDRIGYKIYSCEKEGFYIILSSNTYRMIYFSD